MVWSIRISTVLSIKYHSKSLTVFLSIGLFSIVQYMYLHDEHAPDMCSTILATVGYQITHVSDEAGLATAGLSHDHHWDIAPVGEVSGWGFGR